VLLCEAARWQHWSDIWPGESDGKGKTEDVEAEERGTESTQGPQKEGPRR